MPPKTNRMAEEAEKQNAEELAARTYMADASAWDTAEGEEFGGKSEILVIRENEVAGPFTYVGHQQMTTDLGDTTVHLGKNKDGEAHRLPIQATFLRAVDQAALKRDDIFLVKREADQIKKRGAGKDKPMAIYAIKVIKRAPVAPAAP